jgi:hypothetical protein
MKTNRYLTIGALAAAVLAASPRISSFRRPGEPSETISRC